MQRIISESVRYFRWTFGGLTVRTPARSSSNRPLASWNGPRPRGRGEAPSEPNEPHDLRRQSPPQQLCGIKRRVTDFDIVDSKCRAKGLPPGRRSRKHIRIFCLCDERPSDNLKCQLTWPVQYFLRDLHSKSRQGGGFPPAILFKGHARLMAYESLKLRGKERWGLPR